MKKNKKMDDDGAIRLIRKGFLIMKLFLIFMVLGILQSTASVYSQNKRFSLNEENISIREVIELIEEQSEYRFFYEEAKLNVNEKLKLDVENSTIKEVLDELFKQKSVVYKIMENNFIVLKSSKSIINSTQQKNVKGNVSDSSGQPLPGVSIIIKGTTQGTITDFDGNFALGNVPDDATLIFSFVGMISQELQIGDQTLINVTLVADAIGIEEVVAVGYGFKKSADLTYSVSKVKSEVLGNRPVGRLETALQGQLAGVTVRQGNGGPGSSPQFMIRGVNSINAGSGPLYVIDGLPILDASIIGTLNMNAVESIEVLKDASAAAIYGSRGAGGVVIITTKKGQKGKIDVSYNGYVGIQRAEKLIDMLSGPEQRSLIKEAYEDVNGTGSFVDWNIPEDESYDHIEDFFKSGNVQGHEISLSSGTDKSNFFASINYYDQDGIIQGAGFEKLTSRMNASFKINPHVEIGSSIEAGYSDKQETQTHGKGNALNHILAHAAFVPLDVYRVNSYDPAKAMVYENPLYGLSVEGSRSLDRAEFIDDHLKRGQILSNTYINVELLPGLALKSSFGFIYVSTDRRKFNPGNRWDAIRAERWTTRSTNWLSETTLHYDKSFEKHNVDLLLGYTSQKQNTENSAIRGDGFANGTVPTLNGATTFSNVSNNINNWGLVSYLGRVMYGYENKYLLSVSVRRDGSSRFGSNTRWGIFPAASVGWKINNEEFFNIPIMNLLKLRFSWGQTGNNQIGDYDQYGLLSPVTAVFNGSPVGGYAVNSSQVENPELKWEKNNSINLGLDAGLWNGRLQLNADYYKNTTSDLLLNVPLPTISGYSQGRQNVGEVVNKGIDLEITSVNILKNDLSWRTTFVFNINDNEVTKMNEPDAEILDGPWYAKSNLTRVGEAIGSLYMWKADGIYNDQAELDAHNVEYDVGTPRVGDVKIADINNDGKINEEDRAVVGQPMAKYTFGITNTLKYKNFDVSMVIAGAGGNKIYNAAGREPGNFNSIGRRHNKYAYFADRWTTENTDAKYPRVSGGQFPYSDGNAKETTLDLFDGDYWRIKNLTIGYEIDQNLLGKYISKARVYFSAENLYLHDKYVVGFNPEANSPEGGGSSAINGAGMDYASFPNPKTFTLGVNLSF